MSETSRPSVDPNKPQIRWVQEDLSVGEKRPERDVEELRVYTSSVSIHLPGTDRNVLQ